MNADCAYFIGQGHVVCQDYAAVRMEGERGWAFLSDGCSSSPDTDIGARFLARAAARLMPEGANLDEALTLAACCAGNLGLPPEALDATLLTIDVDTAQFRIQCAGDGVVALEQRDGTLEVHTVQYPTGYPDYLNYRLDPTRHAQFAAQDRGKEITTSQLTTAGVLNSTMRVSSLPVETWTGEVESYRTVAVFSDGMQSFRSLRPEENAPEGAIIAAEMMAFKTRRGAFVQRRALAFRRDCARRGWSHDDDLSVAAVQWGEE